ncbi:hypothetical protein AS026_38870 [Rhizobium altiplani]|uniref:Uncharacterized protein n=1 Tax=Rhizobium altiplani TaxID=1864509 RepID=A0A120FMZ7_9HYPH|nr:hypothetical protein AS026_38870 [Rhizobium altiplani]
MKTGRKASMPLLDESGSALQSRPVESAIPLDGDHYLCADQCGEEHQPGRYRSDPRRSEDAAEEGLRPQCLRSRYQFIRRPLFNYHATVHESHHIRNFAGKSDFVSHYNHCHAF